MITLSKISLHFGSRTIFDELSAIFQDDDRIGLVGRNGYGKSTLLKIIAGQQEVDSGTVFIIKGKRIAYLNQEIVIHSEKHALEHVVDGALKEAELLYSSPAELRAQADKILRGLGLTDTMLRAPVNELSGGWKMRVLLGQLLVQKADFYLFDEPTNHLDIVAKDWFLHFLQRSNAGFLLVCHEKYFLNTLCKKILALDTPQGKLYQGNYDAYCTRYQADLQALEAAHVQQQKMIKQKKETIARFGASASRAAQAQSMKKELERLTLVTMPPQPPSVHIPLPEIKPCGNNVLTVKNLSAGYGTKSVFSGIEFELKRSEKVAIIAPNGVGKTTLLHTLAGEINASHGTIAYGNAVTKAVFHQEQALVLNPNLTVWQEVTQQGALSSFTDSQIRAMLGAFLFTHDDIYKKISYLSGGEKSRVGMIKVLIQKTNLLLLDEPTNHLDIPSKEILLKTLRNYTGTILFVSHDHIFVNELASAIIELTPTSAQLYPGNYDSYLQQKKYAATASTPNKIATFNNAVVPQKQRSGHHKIVKKIEQTIDRLAQERNKLTTELEHLAYGTPDFTKRYDRLQILNRQEVELLAEWETYQEQDS